MGGKRGLKRKPKKRKGGSTLMNKHTLKRNPICLPLQGAWNYSTGVLEVTD